jgi:hypothetical protein
LAVAYNLAIPQISLFFFFFSFEKVCAHRYIRKGADYQVRQSQYEPSMMEECVCH